MAAGDGESVVFFVVVKVVLNTNLTNLRELFCTKYIHFIHIK